MSKAQVIARLEALLQRVRSRSAVPRMARPGIAVAAAPDLDEDDVLPTRPPPAMTAAPVLQAPPAAAAPQDLMADAERDEDTSADVMVDVLMEESFELDSADSRERLVAASPAPVDAVPAASDEGVVAVDDGPDALAPVAAAPESAPSSDVHSTDAVDEAPISSRRPLVPEPEEQLAEMAFSADEPRPPIHTPPPESGRLPAAAGPVDFDGDVTGVRVQPVLELVPEETRGQLDPSDDVVDVLADAQRFDPPTFVALLDASLAL